MWHPSTAKLDQYQESKMKKTAPNELIIESNLCIR